jgi:PPOX class probable F420-dependent enzyme
MDITEALTFATTNHRAVLGTYRQDGLMQLSPVAAGSHPDGFVEISSRETAFKVRNLRRNPRVSLCVMNDQFYGKWLQIDGSAEIVSLPEAMEGLVDYYRRVAGEHDDWDDYRASMTREKRVLIRIHITHAGPDQSG